MNRLSVPPHRVDPGAGAALLWPPEADAGRPRLQRTREDTEAGQAPSRAPIATEPCAAAPAAGQMERAQAPSISCVVPCRNEAENLARLLPLLMQTLDACTHAWEIVLVDDGSTDTSPLRMAEWAQQAGVRVLQLSRNFGKEAALSAGLQAAVGEVVVALDADLQHPPTLIPVFLQHWLNGADVVYALRQSRQAEPWFKRIGTRCFYAMVNAADRFEVPAGAGDFRLMDRSVVDALCDLPERNRFMKGLYAWVGFRTVAVPYEPCDRAHGRSRFGPLQLIRLSLDGLTGFTTWPLRAVSAMGLLLALPALGYGVYLTAWYLMFGHQVSGWTTIVVALMLFAGLQMISLGVVGEYVARIFEEVKARPLFIVKRELGSGMKVTRRC